MTDKDTTVILDNLQAKGEYYHRLCTIESRRINDLEDAIRHIDKEIEKYKSKSKASAIDVLNKHVTTPNPIFSKTDGVNISDLAHHTTVKTLNVFETRLNRLLQRKSDIISEHKKLKDEINHYRRLRVQTDMQHNKYETILLETKLKIERLLNESAYIVEERDKLLDHKSSMEKTNKDEQLAFEREYEDMGNFINKQNKALENALMQERKQDLLEKKGIKPKVQQDTITEKLSLEQELEMAEKVGMLTNFVRSEENIISDTEGTIQSYKEIFDALKGFTGASSMEDIITSYVHQEEELFSLYNFILTLNSDINKLEELKSEIESSIKEYQDQLEVESERKNKVIDELKRTLKIYEDNIEKVISTKKQSQESVFQISKKISSLFFKLQCDQIDNMLSGVDESTNVLRKSPKKVVSGINQQSNYINSLVTQGVSEANVLDYLGCIEHRTHTIVASYSSSASVQRIHRRIATGPLSPVNWSFEPIINVSEINDAEDLFVNGIGNEVTNDNNTDDFFKPIDINQFKDKLQKELLKTNKTLTHDGNNKSLKKRNSSLRNSFNLGK